MTTIVDVQLIEGLGLPYVDGAEGWLEDESFDPLFNDTWQEFVTAFPGQTLTPSFNDVSIDKLADLLDGIRLSGQEPPNLFLWFTLTCDDSEVDPVLAAVQALPMVNLAQRRLETVPARTISYGTNPHTSDTRQIQPSPIGVDAIYAWQVAGGAGDGVLVADIEGGWRLDHEELVGASIRKLSVFGSTDVSHGTSVAGIVVGSDNGVGTVGIVPAAEFGLITEDRGTGFGYDLAKAIRWAGEKLQAGDVLLIEQAQPFVPADRPEILVEFDPRVQDAIRFATGRHITVIEPAGNGTKDLDSFPFLAHTSPRSPRFKDSGAIVVGAGEFNDTTRTWKHTFSSYGSRVNCFADGGRVWAPKSASTSAYDYFNGTSAASAIIAGVAASIQAMWRAAKSGVKDKVLPPEYVRILLSNPELGTLPDNPSLAKIGPMPDLRKITRAMGLARVLPVGAAQIGGGAIILVHLDAENRMVRRKFTSGWWPPMPTPTLDGSPSESDSFELSAAQPAVTSSEEDYPIHRTVWDAFFTGRDGRLHHMWWDSRYQSGNVLNPIAPNSEVAKGRALAAVRPLINVLVLAAINPQGRLVVFTGDPQVLLSMISEPVVLNTIGMYRRVAGPTLVSRSAGLVDIVTIEDSGSLHWFTGKVSIPSGIPFPWPIATTFSGPITDLSAVQFHPGARPALLATGNLLLAAAVGSDGLLRTVTINPVTRTIATPVVIDASVSIETSGPVALGRTAVNVVALAVDKQGTVRAATRPLAGGNWTPLLPLFPFNVISPLGGVTVVSINLGVMAIAVNAEGMVCSAISLDGLIWSPLVPLP